MRVLGIFCTFMCAVVALACGAVLVLVVRDDCNFTCTEDTPGAVLENEGIYSCNGTLMTRALFSSRLASHASG